MAPALVIFIAYMIAILVTILSVDIEQPNDNKKKRR